MKTFMFACYALFIASIYELEEYIELEGGIVVDNTVGLLINGKVNANSKEEAIEYLNKLIKEEEDLMEHELNAFESQNC